jgi:hypothetical protein
MGYLGVISKAEISVCDEKNGFFATIIKTLLGNGTCLFNPSEFSISREVSYAEHKIPGLGRPVAQFISGGAEILQMSLLFDTFSTGLETHNILATVSGKSPDPLKLDVRKLTEPITKLTEVSDNLHAPPAVKFKWGKIIFKGYLISVTEKFTKFNSLGTPVRSVLEIVLRSNAKDDNVRNSPDRTKHRTVVEGDRLSTYAFQEYDSCTQWRFIADANGMGNPRLLRSGANIVIPPI